MLAESESYILLEKKEIKFDEDLICLYLNCNINDEVV